MTTTSHLERFGSWTQTVSRLSQQLKRLLFLFQPPVLTAMILSTGQAAAKQYPCYVSLRMSDDEIAAF